MIRIYGKLAKALKKHYPSIEPKQIPCHVHSAGEAIRALCSQFPLFKKIIKRNGHYKVVRGDDVCKDENCINEKEINLTFNETSWCFMPIAAGAGGKGGLLMIVLGASLIAASFMFTGGTANILLGVGLSMFFGGLSTLLMPAPKIPKSKREDTPSYLFNGSINIDEPGVTIPVIYGETFCGSIVTSFGIRTFRN